MEKEGRGLAGAFRVHANIFTTKEVSSKDHSVSRSDFQEPDAEYPSMVELVIPEGQESQRNEPWKMRKQGRICPRSLLTVTFRGQSFWRLLWSDAEHVSDWLTQETRQGKYLYIKSCSG